MAAGFGFWKQRWRSLRIKTKLFLLITISMAVSSGISLIGLQIAYTIYDEQIYGKSAQVLNLSAALIENELKKMERLTFNIMSDEQIQQYLKVMRDSGSEYELNQARSKLADRLVQYVNSETYIVSADILDLEGNTYSSRIWAALSNDKLKQVYDIGRSGAGSLGWVYPDASEDSLIAVRQIRSYDNLDLKELGILLLRINMDKVVDDYAREAVTRDGEMLIVAGQQLIYPRSSVIKPVLPGTPKGYQIIDQEGEKYFISHIHSDYSDWTYYNTIPFQRIFQNLSVMKNGMIGTFVISFFLLVGFGMTMARSITRPMEGLISHMRGLQTVDLENSELNAIAPLPVQMDEVGLLLRTYRMMIQRIQELIKENYSKQLMIKETEFKALQAQINPHFLYNTLESINWISKMNGQRQVSQMVEALGFLLRASISLKRDMITIGEELQLVQHYVTIQKVRFEERLDFRLDVPDDLHHCFIPKLTLQPLLENAIQYALEVMIEPCTIRIAGRQAEAHVELTVEDNGPGIDEACMERLRKGELQTKGTGIGLRNIDERIRIAFGEGYGVRAENREDGGTRVIIRIPVMKKGATEHG